MKLMSFSFVVYRLHHFRLSVLFEFKSWACGKVIFDTSVLYAEIKCSPKHGWSMSKDSSTTIMSLLCCLVPHRAHTAVPEVQIIWQCCHHAKEMQVPPSGVLITITPAHNQEVKQRVTSNQVKRDVFFFFPDDGRTKPMPRKGHTESFEPADNKCLIRASDGKKKISTVVSLLCFICLFNILYSWMFFFLLFLLNSCFRIAGQHQRSNQVSDGRWSYFQSQPCLGTFPLRHSMEIFRD